jgi:PTS system mannose-specific IIA component
VSDEIAILLMSHGDFAKEAMKSAEMVFGKQDNYETMSVFLVDQVDALRQEMLEKVEKLDTSKGLLVFTDIVGGTPMNLAGSLLGRENTIVCSGLNLPVLIEALMNRNKTVQELKTVIEAAYQMGMTIRTEILEEEEDDLL